MVAAEFTRKPPRSRNPAPVAPRRPAARRVAQPNPLRAELSQLLVSLELVMAVVFATVKALERQAAEQDEDIALVLKRHVGDALAFDVEKLRALLHAQGAEGNAREH